MYNLKATDVIAHYKLLNTPNVYELLKSEVFTLFTAYEKNIHKHLAHEQEHPFKL